MVVTDDDDTSLDDILKNTNFNDPFYDLELIDVPKINYDPKGPIEKITGDLNKFGKHFKVGHLNFRSLNKNFIEFKHVIDNTDFDVFAGRDLC